jgi:hypothetical protein
MFIDCIEKLKGEMNIIVLTNDNNHERYSNIYEIKSIKMPNEEDVQNFIDKNIHIDQSEMEQIEKELGTNCFALNINYLLYRKFLSRYGAGENIQKRNKNTDVYVVLYYRIIKKLVEKYNADYAVYETMDCFSSYILDAMAKQKIITQAFEPAVDSIGKNFRLRLASGQYRRSPHITYLYDQKNYSEDSVVWANEIVELSKKERLTTKYDRAHMAKSKVIPRYSLNQIINRLKNLKNDSLYPSFVRLKNRFLVTKEFSNKLPENKYIAYFLQLTPEASMCSQTPELVNQEIFLEQIAIYARYGYSIVIKEHPIAYGNRPAQFYKELKMFPNVTILPPSYDVREIILNSSAVLVATATSPGYESFVDGVPIIALGNPLINISKNVRKINSPKEIWDHIDKLEFDHDDQIRFLAAFHSGSAEHPHISTDKEWVASKGIGEILASELKRIIPLYENEILNSYN